MANNKGRRRRSGKDEETKTQKKAIVRVEAKTAAKAGKKQDIHRYKALQQLSVSPEEKISRFIGSMNTEGD
ncbi:hypothetical protein OWV82_023603 [Melia azedarach]|uniref:Uncharacterized protein n=1 Tax=Melia azedarach TaxID=155640 RepID=A0ACC1WXD6_MELAZ|nr:hypothetical protein OWV82_023603 [Melia azedarach]